MNTSVEHIVTNISTGWLDIPTSTSTTKNLQVSGNNVAHIHTILSFKSLKENWDSYGAKRPSNAAITKAINFIVNELSLTGREVFFTTPNADGDILVEVKDENENANLEFVFSGEVEDKVIASENGELKQEAVLNETTLNSYLKWL